MPDTARQSGVMGHRFRRANFGTLEIEITVDDRKAYTRPWTVNLSQRLMPDSELIQRTSDGHPVPGS